MFWIIITYSSDKLTVNIALNKPAYQNRPWDEDDAQNAVDGRKSNRSWKEVECSITYGEQNATWWVNLTGIHKIQFITLSSTTWWTIVIGVKLKFYFFYFTNFIVIVFSIKKIQNNFSKLIIGPWIYQLDDIPLKRGEYVLHLKLFCALLNQSFFCIYCFLIFFLCSFLKT